MISVDYRSGRIVVTHRERGNLWRARIRMQFRDNVYEKLELATGLVLEMRDRDLTDAANSLIADIEPEELQ